MAIDAYVVFQPYNGSPPQSESQLDFTANASDSLWSDMSAFKGATLSGGKLTFGQIFEIEDYSFDIEQVLNIGSQAGGSGAGKVTFNPFSITRKIDQASPNMYQMCCQGTPFKMVSLAFRKSAGGQSAGSFYLRFDFKLVAIKTISWSHDDESPKETMTFEYGGMLVRYCAQNPDGSLQAANPGGWNRVKNVVDQSTNPL